MSARNVTPSRIFAGTSRSTMISYGPAARAGAAAEQPGLREQQLCRVIAFGVCSIHPIPTPNHQGPLCGADERHVRSECVSGGFQCNISFARAPPFRFVEQTIRGTAQLRSALVGSVVRHVELHRMITGFVILNDF